MDERFYSTLALCMRAGKLSYGFDTVKGAVLDGNACLLLIASDISDKTAKETRFLAERYGLPVISLDKTKDELRGAIGKLTGVLAVTDAGLSASLLKASGLRS